MISSSVGKMAPGGSVDNLAEQTGKDPVRPPSMPASSLSDSDGDHACRLEGSNGGVSNRGYSSGAARVSTDGARLSGRVKWFNHHKGFGFINVDNVDGEVFVHQSNINSDGFRSLREEEEVEFDLVIGDDGKKKAFNVTGPGGRPPQGAMHVALAGYHMPPKMYPGMAGMMMNASGPNPMQSMSPPSQGYPGNAGDGILETFFFTSESVTEGHPDKLCDQVSDAVLDACLAQDPTSKVACETSTKTGMVMIFGEITTKGHPDYPKAIREAVKDIGFDDGDKGFDYKSCNVMVCVEEQSPDIAGGVHVGRSDEDMGAGDQGHMFGYASNETPTLMPLTHVLATQLAQKLSETRRDGTCPWLRPDCKTQVTVEYKDVKGKPVPQRIHTIVISAQHSPDVDNDFIRKELKEKIIDATMPKDLMDDKVIYHLNPSGRFVIGGPHGDAGTTGRKIIIDTYGGWGAHGGGAFSGKDPSKVDRSAAYAARWIAKSLVHAKLADRCLVQVSYAIGVAEPMSLFVNSYGTGVKSDQELMDIVSKNFDLRPGVIMKDLDLRRPIYRKTAAFGHFGREDPDFLWEVPKKLEF